VQADAHDRLTLPASAPTLDCTEWGKDPGLDSGFNLVLDRIQYTGVNDIMRLTSLMVMHDFLSRRLAPLQDQPACPAWMYTGVNDIMRQECGPRSSLDEVLLAACLKALTTDQFLVDLVVPAAVYEPICVNQAARTTLLATMPTLDDVDIALVQRGDQSCGMVIPEAGGLAGAAGGHSYSGSPQVALAASQQAAARQTTVVASRQATEEVAPLRPLARASRLESSLTTMRSHPMRMSLCRSGCGGFPVLQGRAGAGLIPSRLMRRPRRRPRLTRRPQTRGPWKRPRRLPRLTRRLQEMPRRRRRLIRRLPTRALRVKPQGRGGRRSCQGLAGSWHGALPSGRDQECGDSKRLHPIDQTTLQGRLETLVFLLSFGV
jgi:hypothetical protein